MSMDEHPTRVPEEPATLDVPDAPQTPRASTAEDLDRQAERLDGAAGSEFVDDRIRLGE